VKDAIAAFLNSLTCHSRWNRERERDRDNTEGREKRKFEKYTQNKSFSFLGCQREILQEGLSVSEESFSFWAVKLPRDLVGLHMNTSPRHAKKIHAHTHSQDKPTHTYRDTHFPCSVRKRCVHFYRVCLWFFLTLTCAVSKERTVDVFFPNRLVCGCVCVCVCVCDYSSSGRFGSIALDEVSTSEAKEGQREREQPREGSEEQRGTESEGAAKARGTAKSRSGKVTHCRKSNRTKRDRECFWEREKESRV